MTAENVTENLVKQRDDLAAERASLPRDEVTGLLIGEDASQQRDNLSNAIEDLTKAVDNPNT